MQPSNPSESGTIFIGFNNFLNKNTANRKPFLSYRDETFSLAYQNLLLSSSFVELVLLDELTIADYRLTTKEILNNYFREYSIQNEYDSVEETMYATSTDGKQSEVMPVKGAFIKKIKDKGMKFILEILLQLK